jgi:hypothetical protein
MVVFFMREKKITSLISSPVLNYNLIVWPGINNVLEITALGKEKNLVQNVVMSKKEFEVASFV